MHQYQMIYFLIRNSMIKKTVSVQEILDLLGPKIMAVSGPIAGIAIDNLADQQHVCDTSLDWIKPSNPNKQNLAECSPAKVLLVDPDIHPIVGKTLLFVRRPKSCLAEIGNFFFVKSISPGIHPTAIIHPEANIGKNVSIGPYCVIGKATIGDYTVMESHVQVSDFVIMGHDCFVKSGAVLGDAGFGFETDEEGTRFRFPQIGQLVIGDYVEVGANSSIDRGALSDTVIGNYTKISSLCHIAHNNWVGERVMITCGVCLSGSNIIEDDVWIAPNVSLKGGIHIGRGSKVGLGAVVVKDIPEGETWVGNPARKLEKKV